MSYNAFVTSRVASSDYEGVVTVWDAETKTAVCEFEEHDKRAWTVDFCRADAKLLASGSDDGRVKVWSTDAEASVLELDVRANVRAPGQTTRALAVGCADRGHPFDLRYPAGGRGAPGHRRGRRARVSTQGTSSFRVHGQHHVARDVRARHPRGGDARARQARGGLGPARALEGTSKKNFVGLSVGGEDPIARIGDQRGVRIPSPSTGRW